MKNSIIISVFIYFFSNQFSFSQVDVVYNDLVWSDEFNVSGPINATNWFHQTQLPAGGSWFNGEVQHYTNALANSFVENGMLNITAKKEIFTNQGITKQYTSARLNSKYAFKYGRVDVRAKIPVNSGTWPAIWLLGKNVNEDGGYFDTNFGTVDWPACGEIDIMEHGITPSQPINYVQSALHTPSSFGNTTNIGGAIAADLTNNYHIYSMNWSPNQISFLLDGVLFYTYDPAIKNPSNWPFNSEQYLLLNIAMGGIAGNINANYTQSSMLIDYVRVYQNTTVDTQAPTNFVTSVGSITGSSVELLLNSNDNSGTVSYAITYNGQTLTTTGQSGVEKSLTIPNLSPNTSFTFSVTATDASGNNAANNALLVTATTTNVIQCTGSDTQAQQGSFVLGYNYTFETVGTNVKITCEMLDNQVGLVAYLWKQAPFTETPMTNLSGTIFTKTISGQTSGATIYYAVKFAFAGGLAVTKYISYVVGTNCSLTILSEEKELPFYFQNPAKEVISIESIKAIQNIEIYSSLGVVVLKSDTTHNINIAHLPKGLYFISAYAGLEKSTKKLIIE